MISDQAAPTSVHLPASCALCSEPQSLCRAFNEVDSPNCQINPRLFLEFLQPTIAIFLRFP